MSATTTARRVRRWLKQAAEDVLAGSGIVLGAPVLVPAPVPVRVR